jgi:hypothetical protein
MKNPLLILSLVLMLWSCGTSSQELGSSAELSTELISADADLKSLEDSITIQVGRARLQREALDLAAQTYGSEHGITLAAKEELAKSLEVADRLIDRAETLIQVSDSLARSSENPV